MSKSQSEFPSPKKLCRALHSDFSATFTSHSNLSVLLLKSPYFSNLSRPQKMIEKPRSPEPWSTWITHGLMVSLHALLNTSLSLSVYYYCVTMPL